MKWLSKLFELRRRTEEVHIRKNEYTNAMLNIQKKAKKIRKHTEAIILITNQIAIATGARKRGLKL